MPKASPETNKAVLTDLAVNYHRLFNQPAGVKVLEDLQDAYTEGSPMVTGDPYATAYNVGAQDVVRYIQSMIKLAEEAHNND